jgi:hypothetical protein
LRELRFARSSERFIVNPEISACANSHAIGQSEGFRGFMLDVATAAPSLLKLEAIAPPVTRRWAPAATHVKAATCVGFVDFGGNQRELLRLLHEATAIAAQWNWTVNYLYVASPADVVNVIGRGSYDAFLVYGLPPDAQCDALFKLPCVSLLSWRRHPRIWANVAADDWEIGCLAAKTLVQEGHAELAFVSEQGRDHASQRQYDGFAWTAQQSGAQVWRHSLLEPCQPHQDGPPPTGWFITADAADAARELPQCAIPTTPRTTCIVCRNTDSYDGNAWLPNQRIVGVSLEALARHGLRLLDGQLKSARRFKPNEAIVGFTNYLSPEIQQINAGKFKPSAGFNTPAREIDGLVARRYNDEAS